MKYMSKTNTGEELRFLLSQKYGERRVRDFLREREESEREQIFPIPEKFLFRS